MEKSEAEAWVAAVIAPNGLTSVHELAVAANPETTARDSWITTWPAGGIADPLRHKLRLRGQSLLNSLKLLSEAELKTLGTGSSSRSVANTDSTGIQNLTVVMALQNQRGVLRG